MSFQQINVPAEDGFVLAVQRFDPPVNTALCAAVVIGCATGVHARFYRDFAAWLASKGVGTCTFDYRYSGLSFPPPFDAKKFTPEERHAALLTAPKDVSLTETWARTDFKAVIRYTSERWSQVPLTVMGHSLGGHLMTLIPSEWPSITRFLCLNAGNAYYRNQPDAERNRQNFIDVVVKPLETEGVWRASRLGLGFDLPYSCGKEWSKWYFHPFFSLSSPMDRLLMQSLNLPLLSIGFADDAFVGKHSMMQHVNLLPTQPRSSSQVHLLWIDPRTAPSRNSSPNSTKSNAKPWPPIGHVGAFQTTSPPDSLTKEETIWAVLLDWIVHGRIDPHIGEHTTWGLEDKRDLNIEVDDEELKSKL